MEISLRTIGPKAQRWLKPAGLALAGVAAIYVGALQLRKAREVAEQRATGLSAAPASLWRQEHVVDRSAFSRKAIATGLVGGVPGGIAASENILGDSVRVAGIASPEPATQSTSGSSDRKMVRTDSLDLVVRHPAEAAEQIRRLASRLGGFLVTSEVSGDADAASASLTIRVPAARFEEARNEIRKLGLRVESERVEAQDVTRQYVDQESHLRNLRAEEQQYLAILKHAATVKDTLDVSERLGQVRGEIEQQQAEFEALSKQVETVAITVSLSPQADAQVFGLHWRPSYRLKMAAREGLDGLGDYLATMTSLVFYLPTVLLWLATILIGAALGWRILRRCTRLLFAFPKSTMSAKGAD
jgi:Domain of unknown function (DUF4349)